MIAIADRQVKLRVVGCGLLVQSNSERLEMRRGGMPRMATHLAKRGETVTMLVCPQPLSKKTVQPR